MKNSLGFLITTLVFGSVDCPNLITFAQGLHMDVQNPSIWSELQIDCCSATGVVCPSTRVTEISWASRNLNGTILGNLLPATLTAIDLSFNSLTGSIPSLPPSLVYIRLFNNALSGSIPTIPSSCWLLALQSNSLTGSVPAYPLGLQLINLSFNRLSGIIPSPLPNTVVSASFSANLLNGSIPSPLPLGLIQFYAYGNQMSGDVPAIPASLQELGLGLQGLPGNHFTGSVTFRKPIRIYLNYNWITDLIVEDNTGIVECDISDTPLLGNANMPLLPAWCIKNGIYDANLLPNTIIRTTTTKSLVLTTVSAAKTSTTSVHVSTEVKTTTTLLTGRAQFVAKYSSSSTRKLAIITFDVPQELSIAFNALIILRLFVCSVVLIAVLIKTPWFRMVTQHGSSRA